MQLSQRELDLNEKPIKPLFWQYSIPAITGMIVQSLYNIVDRIFIGHMPQDASLAMGGLGIVMPILFIMMGFSMLFGIGAGANISIKLGEKKHEQAQMIFEHALIMLCLSSVILVLIGLIKTDDILLLLGATQNNLPFARDYARILLVGNLYNTYAFAFTHIIRSQGAPKVAMTSMILGAFTNIALDPLFIYTFNWGVKGAAYATIIAQAVSLAWSVRYLIARDSILTIKLVDKFDVRIVLSIMAIGLSPFFIQIAGSVVGAMLNNQLKFYGGEVAQSAYIAFQSITQLIFMPIFGMNQGLQPIIGYNYGAKNYIRVKQANNVGLKYATILASMGWLACILFPMQLVSIVTNDAEVLAISSEGIRLFESMMFVVGLQIISSNFFQSIGKAKISFMMNSLRQLFILLPLIIFLPKFFGLKGIWLATPISDLLATLITITLLLKEYQKINRLVEQN